MRVSVGLAGAESWFFFFLVGRGKFLLFPAGNGIEDEKFIKRSINFTSLSTSANQFAVRPLSKKSSFFLKETIKISKWLVTFSSHNNQQHHTMTRSFEFILVQWKSSVRGMILLSTQLWWAKAVLGERTFSEHVPATTGTNTAPSQHRTELIESTTGTPLKRVLAVNPKKYAGPPRQVYCKYPPAGVHTQGPRGNSHNKAYQTRGKSDTRCGPEYWRHGNF